MKKCKSKNKLFLLVKDKILQLQNKNFYMLKITSKIVWFHYNFKIKDLLLKIKVLLSFKLNQVRQKN